MGWTVPRLWEGGECWIIGGGTSMPRQFDVPEEVIQRVVRGETPPSAYSSYMSAIHDRHVIAVNVAYLIGDWIDMVFFGDNRVYLAHREGLAKFKGLKVTCAPKMKYPKFERENIKFLQRDANHKLGLTDDPRRVSWNNNSGAAAINVAVNMGVKRVVLLGFDMKTGQDGRQHWHDLYKVIRKGKENKKQLISMPFNKHLKCFPYIKRDADKRGIEIVNASPDSVITVFRKTTVKDLLDGT